MIDFDPHEDNLDDIHEKIARKMNELGSVDYISLRFQNGKTCYTDNDLEILRQSTELATLYLSFNECVRIDFFNGHKILWLDVDESNQIHDFIENVNEEDLNFNITTQNFDLFKKN